MKKYFLIIIACLLIPAFLNAQSIRKAQKQMEKYNYSKAVSILKKAAFADKTRNQAIPLLAECYRLQRDIFNTKAWYAQAVALPEANPMTFFYYAKALQATGDNAKAREMFLKYYSLFPSDERGKNFASHCDSVLGPWKKLKPAFEVKTVNNINTRQSDFGPALYSGELIFASDNNNSLGEINQYGWTGRGYLNIKKSRPSAPGEFWGEMDAPTDFNPKFNQVFHDGPAAFSKEGNAIYFTRSYFIDARRDGKYKTGLLKIFYSTRSGGEWGEVEPFFLNSPDYSVGHPALSADGKTLYFASDMPGGLGGTDIWMCYREGNAWGQAVNLGPVVNTKENEMFPTMRDDGTLYFSSEGHPGYGALDIFKTKNINGNWTRPLNLHPPLNSSFDDFAMAFVPGENNGFFSSNRPGGVGNDDIYAFREIIPVELPLAEKEIDLLKPSPSFIMGVVKDKVTGKPIENATVFAFNPNTGKVLVLKTGPDGVYKAPVERPSEFTVKAMKPTFISDCLPFPVTDIKPGTTTDAPRDLLLDKLELNRIFRIDNIYYDFDKYNIRADAAPELDKLVRIMQENPINVELGSHTDCRGSFAYNDKLSQNRAESAVRYIINAGIQSGRITAKGYGEHKLNNRCADGVNCSDDEHQANRRTEFKIIEYSTPQQQSGQFNPDLFKNGEELDARLMPGGFFSPCK